MKGRRNHSPEESVAFRHPALLLEWHPTKNRGGETLFDVTPGSGLRAWWQCQNDPWHVWQTTVKLRVDGLGCKVCNKRKALSPPLLSARMDLALEWHPDRNGALGPGDVSELSHQVVWWRCLRNRAHAWRSSVRQRTVNGTGCPFCSGRKVRPISREPVHSALLSVECPDIAREWHPTKNGDSKPEEFAAGSSFRAWWRCGRDPRHEWATKISQRTRRGHGCPACSRRAPSYDKNLAAERPDLAAEWHPTKNGDRSARDVLPASGFKAWWRCSVDASHEWQSTCSNRSLGGAGCPECRRARRGSFAAKHPELAASWHPTRNRGLRPTDVPSTSAQVVWWRCPDVPGHAWRTQVRSRVISGLGCPQCRGRNG